MFQPQVVNSATVFINALFDIYIQIDTLEILMDERGKVNKYTLSTGISVSALFTTNYHNHHQHPSFVCLLPKHLRMHLHIQCTHSKRKHQLNSTPNSLIPNSPTLLSKSHPAYIGLLHHYHPPPSSNSSPEQSTTPQPDPNSSNATH